MEEPMVIELTAEEAEEMSYKTEAVQRIDELLGQAEKLTDEDMNKIHAIVLHVLYALKSKTLFTRVETEKYKRRVHKLITRIYDGFMKEKEFDAAAMTLRQLKDCEEL